MKRSTVKIFLSLKKARNRCIKWAKWRPSKRYRAWPIQ